MDEVRLPQSYRASAGSIYRASSWYSIDRPRKDERLSWPWSHPVVLNTGPLDWESSALTTRPLLVVKALDYQSRGPVAIKFFYLVTTIKTLHQFYNLFPSSTAMLFITWRYVRFFIHKIWCVDILFFCEGLNFQDTDKASRDMFYGQFWAVRLKLKDKY